MAQTQAHFLQRVHGGLLRKFQAGQRERGKQNRKSIRAGGVISTCAAGLFVFEAVDFCRNLQSIPRILAFVVILTLTVCGCAAFYVCAKGNTSDSDEIEFDCKAYEGARIGTVVFSVMSSPSCSTKNRRPLVSSTSTNGRRSALYAIIGRAPDDTSYLYSSTSFCKCSKRAFAACSFLSNRIFARSGNLRVSAE